MKNKDIEELLNKLKDNIPEDYIRSVDTEDGIGHYELDIYSWQYKLLSSIEQLEKELEEEQEENYKQSEWLVKKQKKIEQLQNNRDTALEYLENMPASLWNEAHKYNYDFDKLFNLIKGDSDE